MLHRAGRLSGVCWMLVLTRNRELQDSGETRFQLQGNKTDSNKGKHLMSSSGFHQQVVIMYIYTYTCNALTHTQRPSDIVPWLSFQKYVCFLAFSIFYQHLQEFQTMRLFLPSSQIYLLHPQLPAHPIFNFPFLIFFC